MYVNTLVMCPFLCAVLCDVNKCFCSVLFKILTYAMKRVGYLSLIRSHAEANGDTLYW